MMRKLTALLCFSLLFLAAAVAADPIDTYISARDGYIAEFKAHPTADAADKRMDRALGDLERQIKAIVPPWHASSFPSEGKLNLTSLERDVEFGMLDGLKYKRGGTGVVVTTPSLLRHWIADHNRWWEGSDDIPQPFEAGIRSEAFWTYAMFDDVHALLHGEVPVAVRGGTAVVLLARYAQDEIQNAGPDVILTAVVRGERVFAAKQNLNAATVAIPACQTAMQRMLARSDAAYKEYRASGLKDQKAFDEHVRLQEMADRDYRACFAEHLREQPHYKAIIRQAQTLVDLLR